MLATTSLAKYHVVMIKLSDKPIISLPITQISASIASIGNFSSRRLLPVIAKLTDEAKLLITENFI